MGVKTVAFATGFTAPSNFAAAFRRATGETPRQYRQRALRPRLH
jgi:transcriptional regulator GlxA family with amidase domain